MTYLYVLIGILAVLAARNIIAVRRLAKDYAEGVARDYATRNSTHLDAQRP